MGFSSQQFGQCMRRPPCRIRGRQQGVRLDCFFSRCGFYRTSHLGSRGSNPIFEDSDSKVHLGYGFLEPESSDIGYLDPQGIWASRSKSFPSMLRTSVGLCHHPEPDRNRTNLSQTGSSRKDPGTVEGLLPSQKASCSTFYRT